MRPIPPQALGCVLYACFILGRLCIPVFANMSREPFSTRALVLSILHATLPGVPTQMGLGNASLFTFHQFQHLPPLKLPWYLSPPASAHCCNFSSDY